MTDLPDFKTGPLRKEPLNELVGARNAFERLTGDGIVTVNHTGGGVAVGLNIPMLMARMPKGRAGQWFWAEITGNAAADSPAQGRYHYAWEERSLQDIDYDGWLIGGKRRSGTTTDSPARNRVEDGINEASVAPVPDGTIVRMEIVQGEGVSIGEQYWFSDGSGIRGVPLGVIMAWSGSVASIPTGWALCDGEVANDITTVNLKGRFILGIDEDDDAGDNSEDTVGDTGGYRTHGTTENGHTDHPHHKHHNYNEAQVSFAVTPTALTKLPVTSIEVDATTLNTITLTHDDTDNRPRFYVLAYIQHVGT